ncbi:hypothetical protein [Streptomyces sp. NPDC096323]|uniref:hypothetical protein n=1 Tax=Streptomyces sp. NPDC096323 TaxID=3155822 RepID=UPI0033322A4B
MNRAPVQASGRVLVPVGPGLERRIMELQLTHTHRREVFRHHSGVSGAADAAGTDGYAVALTRPARLLAEDAR